MFPCSQKKKGTEITCLHGEKNEEPIHAEVHVKGFFLEQGYIKLLEAKYRVEHTIGGSEMIFQLDSITDSFRLS